MSVVAYSLNFLLERGYRIAPAEAKVIGHSLKAVSGDYSPVRTELWDAVYDAVFGFLDSNAQVGTYSRPMSTALSKAYIDASEIAYEDGGGSLPLDEDTLAYAKAELSSQLGYLDSMFETLKALRKEGDFDATATAFDKANSWANALDGFYNAIKMMGAGNKMLTWVLGNAEKHCADCERLDGQRHRASWYSSHGYTPRRPGSATACGGYNCDCRLVSDDGEEFTV